MQIRKMKEVRKERFLQAVSLADTAGAFLLALCPIVQHYRGIWMDAGEELLCLLLPWLLLRLFARRRLNVKVIVPLAAYAVWVFLTSQLDWGTAAREGMLLVYFAAAANDIGYMPRLQKAARAVAFLAGCLIWIQYLCYYLLGFHLQLVPTGRLLESAGQWISLAQTGRISVTGNRMKFYRPSAFFLEPSHMALYLTPVLLGLLLSPEKSRRNRRMAAFVSLAMLLSTSGLGIAVVVIAWLVYGLFYREKGSDEQGVVCLKRNQLIFAGMFLVGLLLLYSTVDVFRSSVSRIFVGTDGQNSALEGRMLTGLRSVSHLSGLSLLAGRGNAISIADWNMSGFFYTLYKHGVTGCVLSWWFYVRCIRLLKREYCWLAVMVLLLSFFTVHTYAAFYRMYFVSILLQGYGVCQRRSVLETWLRDLKKGISQS